MSSKCVRSEMVLQNLDFLPWNIAVDFERQEMVIHNFELLIYFAEYQSRKLKRIPSLASSHEFFPIVPPFAEKVR